LCIKQAIDISLNCEIGLKHVHFPAAEDAAAKAD